MTVIYPGRGMVPAAVPVTLTASVRKILKKRVRGAKTCWRDRLRAQVVLAAARGRGNERIAADLGICVNTVRKWRGRFAARGLKGLEDLPRSGRPREISEAARAAIVALACQLPSATGVPLARWSGPELKRELAAQGLVSEPLSVTSLLRILAENPVKPWQYQSWIFPRDPDFAAKAKVILDLYQGVYQGEPLRPGDRILSFDAKPSIQARGRIHATLPAAPGRPARVEHEYVRHGALALLAGLDVHTGQVFASTPGTTGIKPFMHLVGQVMKRPEYKDAPRVFVVVDNGSDHRGKAAIERLRKAHPNAIMIHTPVHASWLNQIEIFFSIIQKKVISPNDFPSLEKLSGTLLAFIGRHNQTAGPFSWKYTAADLTDLLRRISEHEKQDSARQSDLAEAA
ncbi:MAG TPA: IS630 family transposase [Streptosporangiaceae bacterium]|jgi:transposase|nr:IS630 family transposase [Streptosporangiaceae bacterium]